MFVFVSEFNTTLEQIGSYIDLSSPLRPPVESVGGNQRTTDLCTFKSPTIYQLTTPSKVGLHHLFVIKNLDIIIEFHSLAIYTKQGNYHRATKKTLPDC